MALGFEWLSFILNIVLDITYYVKILTGSSMVFMGMTIIAMANTFIDLFMDSILSKQGYEIMAVTGIFAGQMFNFLLGFSISGILRFILGNRENFHLFTIGTIFMDLK